MKCTCSNCHRSFVTEGIFPRKDMFFCSIRCAKETIEESDAVALSIEIVPIVAKEQEIFETPKFNPRPVISVS